MAEYVAAFCDAPITRKAVNQLSAMLAQVVGGQLREALSGETVLVGHKQFGGAVRRHHLDCFVANEHMGLQLGVDVKGLNSASSVGKNWNNRVGDLHELAANHHGHFPRAVLGGVLAIPFEGLNEQTLTRLEDAMRQLNGRRVTSNASNVLEVACLMVISKETRSIRPDLPDPNGPLRVEKFAATMAEVYRSRFVR